MPGFSHPITDGNNTMVINNMHSEDWTEGGVDGWYLGRDGHFELGDVLIRNAFAVGRAPDGRTEIGTDGSPSNMIKLFVEEPNPDGIDSPATINVQDDVLFITTLGRGSDSAFVRFVTPDGTDPGSFELVGSGFVSELNRPVEQWDNAVYSTASVAYVALGAGLGFVAPPSGCVIVSHAMDTFNNGVNRTNFVSFRVENGFAGGGGIVVPQSYYLAVSFTTANVGVQHPTLRKLISGLTPGNSYFFRPLYQVSAGTGTFQSVYTLIEPTM
jgi:hypothetical protein